MSTKPAVRSLVDSGGVKDIADLIYKQARGVLELFLENMIRDAVAHFEHAERKTVTAMTLKSQGSTLYGFGG